MHQWQGSHLEKHLGGITDLKAFQRFGMDAQIQYFEDMGQFWLTNADCTKASTSEWVDDANVIMEHLDSWAADAHKRAKALEKPAPGDAMDLYNEIKKKFFYRKSGKAAARRILKLEKDKAFRRELRAWNIFVSMRKAEAKFKVPKGAEPTCKDKSFARANAFRIKRIRDAFVRLQKGHAASRAMLEARSLVRRYAIDVPTPMQDPLPNEN